MGLYFPRKFIVKRSFYSNLGKLYIVLWSNCLYDFICDSQLYCWDKWCQLKTKYHTMFMLKIMMVNNALHKFSLKIYFTKFLMLFLLNIETIFSLSFFSHYFCSLHWLFLFYIWKHLVCKYKSIFTWVWWEKEWVSWELKNKYSGASQIVFLKQ